MRYTYEDVDRRVERTKDSLSDAILEIIKNKNNIKVKDICKKANITRITYYHHFHNKKQLIEFAIKNQLQNFLPIPRKLKPTNMKQLLAYLLKSSILFFSQNKEIILNSVKSCLLKGYKDTYIHIFVNIVRYWIYFEIRNVLPNINVINNNLWTDLITYGLTFLLIRRIENINQNYFIPIWKSFKELRNNL